MSRTLIIFCLLGCIVISGCSQSGYYLQAATGQLSLLQKRTPVGQLLKDPATPEDLRQQLRKAESMRKFAVDTLGLGNNKGFTSYADLERPYATWNVVAAPAYSLQPETWCFPIAGCVSYKGYFNKADAEIMEQTLLKQGKDVLVYGVAAYSTLGWFNDPLLNTFIRYADNDLASLIFHELAHQLVYVKDDSDFNEAFATAIETILLNQWLIQQGNEKAIAELAEQKKKQDRVTGLVLEYRGKLQQAYAGPAAAEEKKRLFREMKQAYSDLKSSGQGTRYYDWWFSRPLDNADLLTVSTYYQLVPDFLAVYEKLGGGLPLFIQRIKQMESLDRDKRRTVLSGESEWINRF